MFHDIHKMLDSCTIFEYLHSIQYIRVSTAQDEGQGIFQNNHNS